MLHKVMIMMKITIVMMRMITMMMINMIMMNIMIMAIMIYDDMLEMIDDIDSNNDSDDGI